MWYYQKMNAKEKEQLYDLLKTLSTAVTGYIPKSFSGEKPVFTDDAESAEIQNSIVQNSIETNFTEQNSAAQNSAERNSISNSISIESIADKISKCQRCQLCKTRTNVVPGTGIKNPLVLVIGEGPGHDEDLAALPFVGKAGQLLDKMLAAISLSRNQNCFIANIVKCRPPQNRDPLPEEISACSSFLEAQITVLKPKMILLMGRIAAQAVLKTSLGINALRGKFADYNGIPVMPTYHPSALLRNEELKAPAWQDLKAFRAKLSELSPDYEKNFKKE